MSHDGSGVADLAVFCATHNVPLDADNRCDVCREETLAAYKKMSADGIRFTTSFIPGRPRSVMIGGQVIEWLHEMSYLEYDIPAVLTDELTAYVKDKVRAFHAQCMCMTCQQQRSSRG